MYLSLIHIFLETDYTVDTAELDNGEDIDIVVIIGVRKNAPTAKPTTSVETSVTTKPTTSAVTPTAGTTTPSPTPTKVP